MNLNIQAKMHKHRHTLLSGSVEVGTQFTVWWIHCTDYIQNYTCVGVRTQKITLNSSLLCDRYGYHLLPREIVANSLASITALLMYDTARNFDLTS